MDSAVTTLRMELTDEQRLENPNFPPFVEPGCRTRAVTGTAMENRYQSLIDLGGGGTILRERVASSGVGRG